MIIKDWDALGVLIALVALGPVAFWFGIRGILVIVLLMFARILSILV